MSQAGLSKNPNSAPGATSYVTNSGTAAPIAGVLDIIGINGISTSASGGTINISMTGVSPENQIYYVGKHGNDSFAGTSIDTAVLTFSHAIALATAQTPSSSNQFAIVCLDDGVYTENITGVEYVDIFAPNASIVGTLTLTDLEHVKFKALTYTGAGYAITKSTGSGYLDLDIDTVSLGTATNGLSCSAGFTNFTWKQLYVVNGYGIGNFTSGENHIHLKGGDIYVSGTGYAVVFVGVDSMIGRVDHILDNGTGVGHGILGVEGEIDLNVSRIEGLALGISIGTTSIFHPVANLQVNVINCTAAYSVGSSGTLNLDCGNITGSSSVTAGGVFNQGVYAGGGYGTNGYILTSNGATTDPTFSSSISLPVADASGNGVYSLGGEIFMHDYGAGGITDGNTFLGSIAGNLTTLTGIRNTGIGASSLNSCTSGTENTGVGQATLNAITSQSGNTAVGANAMESATAENDTAVGFQALNSDTGGNNVAIGFQCMLNATGTDNTAVGFFSMPTVTGVQNTSVGTQCFQALTSGGGGTAMGFLSQQELISGYFNDAYGSQSLQSLTTGSYNVCMGSFSGDAYTGAESSNVLIANSGVLGENNTTRIGTQGSGNRQQNSCYIAGIAGVTINEPQFVTIDPTTGQLGVASGQITFSILGSRLHSIHTSPYSLSIPSAANSVTVLDSVTLRYAYGGLLPLTGGGDLKMYYNGGDQVTGVLISAAALDGTADAWSTAGIVLFNSIGSGHIDNEGFYITADSDFTGSIGDDNVVYFDIRYHIASLQ